MKQPVLLTFNIPEAVTAKLRLICMRFAIRFQPIPEAVGKKNEEIAAVLHITVRTVKFHTGNLYRKLNVSGRMEAIRRATELGIH